MLAIAAKAPVVPVVVHGAREIMRKGAWRVRSGVVHVHLLPPVETMAYDYDHRHELIRTVWQQIADTMYGVYDIGVPLIGAQNERSGGTQQMSGA